MRNWIRNFGCRGERHPAGTAVGQGDTVGSPRDDPGLPCLRRDPGGIQEEEDSGDDVPRDPPRINPFSGTWSFKYQDQVQRQVKYKYHERSKDEYAVLNHQYKNYKWHISVQ